MALDWDSIKTEYVTTDISLSKLAAKHGVTKGALGKKCSAEKWVEDRKRYKNRVLTKTIRKAEERDAARLDKLMRITSSLIDVAMRGIVDDPDQYNRYIVTEGLGEGMTAVSEKQFQKIDTRALKDTVNALKDLTAMVRDFYDIPTAAQREQRDIASARLKIEQEKAKAAEQTEHTIRLVVPPELEGLDE